MNLSKLPSGTWRVSVKHRGERRTGTARTRGEAQRLGAELLLEMGAGGSRSQQRTTIEEMLTAHAAEQAEVWSPTYRVDIERVIDKLGTDAPAFTTRPIGGVTPAVLLGLYRQLDRVGWSRHRVRRLHVVLGTAFKMAVSYGWTNANPCRDVSPPTPDEPSITVPTDAQVRAILAELDGLDHLAVRLNATLGIRRGDLVGIQWPDVDLDRAEILIARSIAVTPGQTHVMPTKSGRRSHRRLALDLPTVAALRRWRAVQTEQAIANGLPSPLWVFSSDAGITPWRPDRVSRLFRRVADRAGVAGVRLHDLRHYVATTMLNDGISSHDVAGQLGNVIATTEAKYRHWLPGRGRESVSVRAARLDASG